jgi:hypothetical protein
LTGKPILIASARVFDRKVIALLLLATYSAHAEDWVVLRQPPAGPGHLPGILIDTSSIVVHESGLRQATTKIDFFGPADSGTHEPNVLTFMQFVQTYDCAKGLKHEESHVATLADGTLLPYDNSKNPKWYPRAQNPAADPAFDFVCHWPTTQVPRTSGSG